MSAAAATTSPVPSPGLKAIPEPMPAHPAPDLPRKWKESIRYFLQGEGSFVLAIDSKRELVRLRPWDWPKRLQARLEYAYACSVLQGYGLTHQDERTPAAILDLLRSTPPVYPPYMKKKARGHD